MAIKLRILAAGDNRECLNFLGDFLHAEGHDVFLARNMATALRLGSESSIDLLLTDLRFPDGDGRDLLTRLREAHPTLIGIALCGEGADSDAQALHDAEFYMHLRKPIDLYALRKAITTCARRIFASPPNDSAMSSGSSVA